MNDPYFNGPLAILVRRLIIHSPPDPWPAEIDVAVKACEAIPLCIDCLHPQAPHRWFCPHCGYPTGDCVNWMEYLPLFSMGEILRRGVTGPPEHNATLNLGFAIYGAVQYSIFAPVYWFWMIRKAQGHPICPVRRAPLQLEELSE